MSLLYDVLLGSAPASVPSEDMGKLPAMKEPYTVATNHEGQPASSPFDISNSAQDREPILMGNIFAVLKFVGAAKWEGSYSTKRRVEREQLALAGGEAKLGIASVRQKEPACGNAGKSE